MSRTKPCPVCQKQFHACGSCGLNHDWEYRFCSLECYNLSGYFTTAIKNMQDFYDGLTAEQKNYFNSMMEDMPSEIYEDAFNKIKRDNA
jgi:hypothetical protein